MKKILYLILSIFLINMFACSKPKEFLVVFDSDGGTLVESVIVLEGEKIVAPVEPTKGNYSFDAWYLGEEKWSFVENVVTEDITLKAKWIINQYTLTFVTIGGSEIEAIT